MNLRMDFLSASPNYIGSIICSAQEDMYIRAEFRLSPSLFIYSRCDEH